MHDISAIFVTASAVVTLLLVACIVGVVAYRRRNDAPFVRHLSQINRTLDDGVAGG